MKSFEDLGKQVKAEKEAKERQAQQEAEAARLAEEHRRIELEATRRLEEAQQRRATVLQGNRQEVESERWGTPQAAYQTWEQRGKETFVLVNKFLNQFKGEAAQAKQTYGHREFRVYTKTPSFVFFDKEKVHRKFTPLDFTYRKVESIPEGWRVDPPLKPNETPYEFMFEGIEITVFHEIFHTTKDLDVPDYNYFKNGEEKVLEDTCLKIFIPVIAIERIESGESYVIRELRKFFEVGDVLKEVPSYDYSFASAYPEDSDTTEDYYTDIAFGSYIARVFNPFYVQKIKEALIDFRIPTYYHG